LNLRRRRWRASTVDTYLKTRPGQGRRTDLVNARAGQRRRDAADLAEPVSSPSPDLAAWLRANHTALLRVADVLVDARAMLMAASFRPELLAEAIDAAGERMTRGPSKAFASAVTYAMGLVQRLPLDRDSDIAIVLHQHGHLRAEFEPYAGPIS
jgi:hypothetical protein